MLRRAIFERVGRRRVGLVITRAVSSFVGAYIGTAIAFAGAGLWLTPVGESRAFEAAVPPPHSEASPHSEARLLAPAVADNNSGANHSGPSTEPPAHQQPIHQEPVTGLATGADSHGPGPSLETIYAEQKALKLRQKAAAEAKSGAAPAPAPAASGVTEPGKVAPALAHNTGERDADQVHVLELGLGNVAPAAGSGSTAQASKTQVAGKYQTEAVSGGRLPSVMRRPGRTVDTRHNGGRKSQHKSTETIGPAAKPARKPLHVIATAETPRPAAAKPLTKAQSRLLTDAPRPLSAKPLPSIQVVVPALKPQASKNTEAIDKATDELAANTDTDTGTGDPWLALSAQALEAKSENAGMEAETDWTPAAAAEPASQNEFLADTLAEAKRTIKRRNIKVSRGDTLMNMLLDVGAERQDAHAAVVALRNVYDPRQLRVGQNISVLFDLSTGENIPLLDGLSLSTAVDKRVVVSRLNREKFRAFEEKKQLKTAYRRARGRVNASLFITAKRIGLPAQVLFDFIQIFSFDVDFQREIQPGAGFDVLYEVLLDDDGQIIKYGAIVFAAIETNGELKQLYRHKLQAGHSNYFSAEGIGARRALMRTPVDGARLTSGFGMRRHPVLRYTRMHRGLDFAAPRGTPVMAAGDGVIERIGRQGGYGRYIRIRHNGVYKTAYAHLNGYAKGLKRNSVVKQGQIIGYVGRSGRVTGTHLHYEVLKNGRQINPLKLRLPKGKRLKGKELQRFTQTLHRIRTLIAATQPEQRVAQNQ